MNTLLLLGLTSVMSASAADLGFRPVYMYGDTGEISCDRSSGPRRFSSAALMEYFEVPRSGNIYAYAPPHERRDERCTRLWRRCQHPSTGASGLNTTIANLADGSTACVTQSGSALKSLLQAAQSPAQKTVLASDLSGTNLSSLSASGLVMEDTNFYNSNFRSARLENSFLSNLRLGRVDATAASFRGSRITGVSGVRSSSGHSTWIYGYDSSGNPKYMTFFDFKFEDTGNFENANFYQARPYLTIKGARMGGADFALAGTTHPNEPSSLRLEGASFDSDRGLGLHQARLPESMFINLSIPDRLWAQEAVLDGSDFLGNDFTGANFRGASLRNTVFSYDYQDASPQAQYPQIQYDHAGRIVRAERSGRSAGDLYVRQPSLNWANFSAANLEGATFRGYRANWYNTTGIRQANFSGARLRGALFQSSDLSYSDFSGAQLDGARFYASTLTGVRWDQANFQGASFSSGGQGMVPFPVPVAGRDLSRVKLHGYLLSQSLVGAVQLTGAELSYSSLVSADLRGAFLEGATFQSVDFTGARLDQVQGRVRIVDHSTLEGVSIRNARLQGEITAMSMRGTELSGVHLSRMRIGPTWSMQVPSLRTDGARFSGAVLEDVIFTGLDESVEQSTLLDAARVTRTSIDFRNFAYGGGIPRCPSPAWLQQARIRGFEIYGCP
jgi:uncharacterized protein YjbI with pentapeptide repeats